MFFLFAVNIILTFVYFETRDIKLLVAIAILFLLIITISWKVFISMIIVMPFLFFIFSTTYNRTKITELNGNYKIVAVISPGYVIKHKNTKILLKTKAYFDLDDLINVKTINLENIIHKKEKYSYYLKSLGIKYIANKADILKLNKKTSIRSKITNYLSQGPNLYVKYISLILIGKKNDLNKELYERIKTISILHLFVISGFHINLLMAILVWIGKKIRINSLFSYIASFFTIFLYLYVLNFPLSSIRAFLFLIIFQVNKFFWHTKFSKINILTFIMLLIFIINPFVVFSLSFIFTFIITFSILFVVDINKKKGPIVILVAYFSSIMISIYINNEVNILGIVNSIIFSPIIIINYILSFLLFPFKEILNYYYIFIDNIVCLFNENKLVLQVNINEEILYSYYLVFSFIIITIKHYSINRWSDVNKNTNNFRLRI